MANSTFAQINTAIYDILDLLDGSGGTLNKIYSYPEPKPDGYPCAFPILAGVRSEKIMDTKDNYIAIDFVVRVQVKDENNQTTYNLLLTLLQEVMAEFRKDDHFTLGGKVERLDVSPKVDIRRTGDSETPVLFFDLIVTAYQLVSTDL